MANKIETQLQAAVERRAQLDAKIEDYIGRLSDQGKSTRYIAPYAGLSAAGVSNVLKRRRNKAETSPLRT